MLLYSSYDRQKCFDSGIWRRVLCYLRVACEMPPQRLTMCNWPMASRERYWSHWQHNACHLGVCTKRVSFFYMFSYTTPNPQLSVTQLPMLLIAPHPTTHFCHHHALPKHRGLHNCQQGHHHEPNSNLSPLKLLGQCNMKATKPMSPL